MWPVVAAVAVATATATLQATTGRSTVESVGWALVVASAGALGALVDRARAARRGSRVRREDFETRLDQAADALSELLRTETAELTHWYPTAERLGDGAPAPRALVLGTGRASSTVALVGRPDGELPADDPVRARVSDLRRRAEVLEDAPLCVPLGTAVLVRGPGALAASVAHGYRLQLRRAGLDDELASGLVTVEPLEPLEPDDPPGRAADTIVTITPQGRCRVVRRAGRPCDTELALSFVSVLAP